MSNERWRNYLTAASMVGPFLAIFIFIFVYPIARMIVMSFTNAPLIGTGEWVGFDNYLRQISAPMFQAGLFNTFYFLALTVVPGTFLALAVAISINRRSGWLQSFALACFFLPSILPVSVVTQIWSWMANSQYGILQSVFGLFSGERPVPLFRSPSSFMPMVAVVTIWWTIGFNVLLFIAALRNIPPDIYEAAALDNASHWTVFTRITCPLIWPITALVLTLQLIAQLKIFSQPYLLGWAARTPAEAQSVIMSVVYDLAFRQNKGGEGAAVATMLFVIILVVSTLQFRVLRAVRGRA